jgi:hypothetical protein
MSAILMTIVAMGDHYPILWWQRTSERLEKRKETVGGKEWIEIGVFNTQAICLVPNRESTLRWNGDYGASREIITNQTS